MKKRVLCKQPWVRPFDGKFRSSNPPRIGWALLVTIGLLIGFASRCVAEDQFRERIVPILQRRCISCHSDSERKGDFSLQSSESAFADGYIEAGDSDASYLIDLLAPVDGRAIMPKNSDPLSSADLAAIGQWIDDGANWPDGFRLTEPQVADLNWWSLHPLHRPEVPSRGSLFPKADQDTQQEDTPKREHRQLEIRTPIDAFIQEKLVENGLQPAPQADRLTLIRRLTFDLTGLPPTPEDIEAFISDTSQNAYEQLVDRLLASEQYGERWARHWLDVAHYADTHGYDKDKPRPHAWPYRDYVIRSLNEDKPYERFVREQIAGDALWPNTVDGVTATGFLAAGPWDLIGHAEVPESKIDGKIARHLDRDDMVASTLNTFCSVTVQCARCHNHKFDPVTQEHYYSLQAVFAAIDRADRPYDSDPQTAARRAALEQRKASLLVEQATLNAAVKERLGERLVHIDRQLALLEEQRKSAGETKPEFGYHSQIASRPDVVKWVQIDLGQSTPIDTILYVGCYDDFNGIGHGFGFPSRYRIEVSDDASFESGVTVVVDHTAGDVPNPGTTPQDVKAPLGLEARYVRMTATKLAHRKNDYNFALAELAILAVDGRNAALGKPVTALDSIEAPVRWQRANLVDGYYVGVTASPKVLVEISRLKDERESLLASALGDDLQAKIETNRAALGTATDALAALPPQDRVYAGTVHTGSGNFMGTGASGGQPRPIHVLHRGNILEPRQPVGPGAIPIIPNIDWQFSLPPEHKEDDRRVALARWLVRRDNPLTWRSIVNRVWQYHFGRGIVDSPNDFGRMGRLPTHPELLDWLAVEFRDGGQSLKKLHRLIVTSSVYRQSSADNEPNVAIDGDNLYLWRMNRRRLTAEELRDAVLSISGRLDRTKYGPGFQAFVIDRPEHSPHYEYDKHDPDAPGSHRRSIYRFIVRSQPDPFMTTLDCADSSQSVAKRDETITALQALSLLNNRFVLRMAEHFAVRLAGESESLEGRVERAFRLVTGRRPSTKQQAVLVDYAEQFGAENLCRLLFNLNEFVFVD